MKIINTNITIISFISLNIQSVKYFCCGDDDNDFISVPILNIYVKYWNKKSKTIEIFFMPLN